jgi:hypothetical protein
MATGNEPNPEAPLTRFIVLVVEDDALTASEL